MSINTQAINEQSQSSVVSMRWIIGAKDDLLWFIGSVATSYALLVLYVTDLLPLIWMVAAWAILIDAPHVFGTFSRTYFDREEWKTRKRLLLGSFLFFAIGPVMVLAGAGFLFFFIAALWAYYHLVKQHYGFMILYKKKNEDLDKIDNVLDRSFLMLAFTFPFVYFIEHDQEAMLRVPIALHSGIGALSSILLVMTIVISVVWLSRQIQRAVMGQSLNVPKYLLLAASIPMHWVVLLTPMPHKPIAIVAILTIYHNFQYHRLIWFHNQKYRKGENSKERFGPAALISKRFLYYIGFGIIFGILYQGPRQFLNANYGDGRAIFITQLVGSFLWGYALIHYYLDSKIWRVRRDHSVGKALQMS